ncbi:MAG TPA: sialidase family protein, partial [Verrucomicrobiae bacterium]
VTFRNADSHQAKDAKIVVIRAKADDLSHWEKVAEWTREHDCRDPLVFDNHGKVQVVFHSQEDFYSQSTTGVTWSEPRELDTEFVEPKPGSGLIFTSKRRWLFRIRRGPDGAFYSLARCGIKDKGGGTFGLILYRSDDGVTFKALHTYGEGPTGALNQDNLGSGWGHEADLAWTPDGTLVAAIRNSKPGVLVMGRAPLGPWKAFSTGANNFGGPALYVTKRGGILLAARDVREPRPDGFPAVCKVWTVTENGVEFPWIIPSGGDCAYQSFADGPGEEVLLVYYSSHEFPQPKGAGFNPANIYLAHLKIRHTKE